jgi:hypothetical protein
MCLRFVHSVFRTDSEKKRDFFLYIVTGLVFITETEWSVLGAGGVFKYISGQSFYLIPLFVTTWPEGN